MKKLSVIVLVLLLVSMVSYGQSCDNSGNDRLIEGKDVTYGDGATLRIKGGNTNGTGGSIILSPGHGMNHDGDVIFDLENYSRVGIGTTNPTSRLHVVGNSIITGKVGIGTTSLNYELNVDGTIRAKEIKVETGWSDFVFADNYNLMPLDKLEQHIKVNRSLPGIPTEKEVLKDGVNLGEMQAKLLKKIEELTLYVIDQDKELNKLKKEVEDLKEENGKLKKNN